MSRVERVSQEIKEAVATILQQEMKDPRVLMVTVTRVRLTGDLRDAVVYFSSLDPKEKQGQVQKVLEKAAPYVRRVLGKKLQLRHTPSIKFEFDPSVEEGIRMEQLFDSLEEKSDDEPTEGHPSDPEQKE
tara:strand:- start:124 stop:513 length:390 start_codon:yes stop_codon:yes gene_type:complete